MTRYPTSPVGTASSPVRSRGTGSGPLAASRRARALTHLVLALALAVTVLPFLWMLLGSFKSQGELLRDPSGWLPTSPTWNNYATWLGDLHIGHYFLNSA